MAWRVGRLAPNFVSKAGTRFVAKQRELQAEATR